MQYTFLSLVAHSKEQGFFSKQNKSVPTVSSHDLELSLEELDSEGHLYSPVPWPDISSLLFYGYTLLLMNGSLYLLNRQVTTNIFINQYDIIQWGGEYLEPK